MRADVYLVENGYAESRVKAQYLITSGCVYADGKTVRKPSIDVSGKTLTVTGNGMRYVSRGGFKLEAAISAFHVEVCGKYCIDIGSSTGGFTDCLLQNGAARVLCVDSGTHQLHSSLRSNPRVCVLEQLNARDLVPSAVGFAADIVVMDVSFISQVSLYRIVFDVLSENGVFISLIKPQFEAGCAWVGKGGIVRKRTAHLAVLERIASEAGRRGLYLQGIILSPITGGDGNIEYLACFSKKQESASVINFDSILPEKLSK